MYTLACPLALQGNCPLVFLIRIYFSLHPQALCVGGDGVVFGGGDAGLVLLRGTRLPASGDTPPR